MLRSPLSAPPHAETIRQWAGADGARNPDTEIASSRLWGAEQQKELKRQERLQKERQLDAADMGAAEADPAELPAELNRHRAKQKQTHNRYVQKQHTLKKREGMFPDSGPSLP